MIKAIVCDIDGSIMAPSSGLYVSNRIKDKLIEVQKRGILVILNSARIIQGVQGLASQICMDEFGGYLISCNGGHCFDFKKKETVFEYPISKEDALYIWDACLRNGLVPSISQSNFMISSDYPDGYRKDHFNCYIDYMVSLDPEKYIHSSIWKCCLAEDPKKIQTCFDSLQKDIVSHTNAHAIYTTADMLDIRDKGVDKEVALDRLLKIIGLEWSEVSVIGDTNSDLSCIKRCGLGVTLENGSEECKESCDLLVPSYKEEGCVVWLNRLLEERK